MKISSIFSAPSFIKHACVNNIDQCLNLPIVSFRNLTKNGQEIIQAIGSLQRQVDNLWIDFISNEQHMKFSSVQFSRSVVSDSL